MSSIENTQDHKLELKISGIGYLTKIAEKGATEIEFDYDANTGLLNSRSGVSYSKDLKLNVHNIVIHTRTLFISIYASVIY